jgi:hypothetical protein
MVFIDNDHLKLYDININLSNCDHKYLKSENNGV